MILEMLAATVLLAGGSEMSDEELGKWLTYYYLNPQPFEAIDKLEALNESFKRNKGISLAEVAERGGLRSFYAEILSSSPEAVELLASRLPELSVDIRVFVNEALRRCVSAACEKVRGTPYIPIEEQLSVSRLDDHWAAFIATGGKEHVIAVIKALPLVEVRGNVEQLMVGGAAKWSLTSNAVQHSRVLTFCREYLEDADESVRKILSEVVSEAEAELSKEPSPESHKAEI
jgi:hypothetical protein